jgi:hypothetical protein
VSWTSPPLADFTAMAPAIEARFGPPSGRDLDSNGVGLFDAHMLSFDCGLEVALWRFHLGRELRRIDPETEPSSYTIHANERDLAHIAFHLAVPLAEMHAWTDSHDVPFAAPASPSVVVMRADDNGNEVEVTRVTSRCEADALVRDYESRGHKQCYWVAG